jgi:hypothetical protein
MDRGRELLLFLPAGLDVGELLIETGEGACSSFVGEAEAEVGGDGSRESE